MKKLFVLTALAVVLSTAQSQAEEYGHHGAHKGGMFQKHDTNGDGSISKAEFLSRAEERFAKMDANGDGVISKDEAQETRAEMKDKMKDRMQKRKEMRGGSEGQ